jgi:hypothetical protein
MIKLKISVIIQSDAIKCNKNPGGERKDNAFSTG